MAQKPSIPKGTRDFSPTEVAKREYITSIIKKSFENFGFQPIETPSFENSSTLMGKYGEEGDRLIFKILNSGDFYKALRMDDAVTVYALEKFHSHLTEALNGDYDSIKDSIEEEFGKEYDAETRDLIFNIREINFETALPKDEKDKGKLHRQILFRYANFFLLNSNKHIAKISEKALRYDLTVPFARYVVQHQNEIEFPFKRYQTQLVWRADRPQKGRFREFYQCDADVVGSTSLWQEVEFVQLYDDVFTKLGLTDTTIKINNRKILSGIAEVIGAKDKLIDFTVALDKLDKIGKEGVVNEMLSKGISQEAINKVDPLFNFTGTNKEKLNQLKGMLQNSDEGTQGVIDLQFVINTIAKLGLQSSNLNIDVTLARGLNYYTGAIFEVEAAGVKMGSIGGGGRYDDLTSVFGLKNMGGVGISFGLDRIYLVLEELDLFKAVILPKPTILFLNFGDNEALYCMEAIKKLRALDIKSEIYPDNTKLKKQMNYANKREIPFVVFVGLSELENDKFTLKNMSSGEQKQCNFTQLLQTVKNL